MNENIENQEYSKSYALLIVAVVAMGGVLYGYDVGIINAAMLYIGKEITMTQNELAFIASAVFGGGTIAIFVTGPLADFFGRKLMLFISSLIFLAGVYAIYIADSYTFLLAGRVLQGLGVGIMTLVIPLYLAEITSPAFRGRGTAVFQLMLTAGILLASVIGLLFSHGETGDWRGMFLSCAGFGALFAVGIFFIPRSPRWLIQKGRKEEAFAILRKTLNKEEYEHEIAAINKKEQENAPVENFLVAIKQKAMLKPFIIVVAVAVLNQLIGIAPILQYSAVILKSSGASTNTIAIIGSIWITVINVGGTVIGLALVDKLGRRPLLLTGTGGATLCLLLAGLSFTMGLGSTIVMAAIMGFILFFAIGPGVCVWLALSELLPGPVRSNGMAIGLTLNSLAATAWSGYFLLIGQNSGFQNSLFISAFFCLVYFLVTLTQIPETKGKTLDEIEAHFRD